MARAEARGGRQHAARRAARRIALSVLFEADFGQQPALRILERELATRELDEEARQHARAMVEAVVRHREELDARIEAAAPAYPVVQLARIDRALLRSALGEMLHCAATPTRVAISEWVAMARTYSGEPARRLVNGVLGRIAGEAGASGQASSTIMGPPAADPDRQ
ncbi:MAG TPA: transcription antitermination factor NusB [Candidatus Limnocylindrales bacterium]|nr:transcription antitermination factor NusB [Candidatus Limnocylindrales bacterium]